MKFSAFQKSLKKATKHQPSPWKYFEAQNKIDATTLHQALANPEQTTELLQELEQIIYGYNRFY